MADQARDLYDKDSNDSGESKDPIKPSLYPVKGGGQGDGKPTGKLKSVDDDSSSLAEKEKGATKKIEDKKQDSLYKGSDTEKSKGKGKIKSKSQDYLKKKSAYIAMGLFGSLFGLMVSMLLLFTPFKFEFFFQNIDAATFLRYNAIFDNRSSKFLDAYIQARTFEIESPNADPIDDNLFFRSNRVDTNSPMTDWYRTMRASSFEADLLEKHGIKFTGVAQKNPDGSLRKITSGFITIKGDPVDFDIYQVARDAGVNNFDEAIDLALGADGNGNITQLTSIFNSNQIDQMFDIDVFENDRAARRTLRKFVAQETRWYEVIRRRNVRRNIQNMIGVRDWRFFEGTRSKIDNYKINFQRKLIDSTFGKTNNTGKFFACLLGGSCPKTGDPAADSNQKLGGYDGDSVPRSTGDVDIDETVTNPDEPSRSDNAISEAIQETMDDFANADAPVAAARTVRRVVTSKIFVKLNLATGLVEMADTMVILNNMLKSEQLTKMVKLARISQYSSLYTTYRIMGDQINSGEQLTAAEVGAAVSSIDGFEAGEAWQTLVNNKPLDRAAKNSQCQTENRDRSGLTGNDNTYLCDDEKIAGDTNASKLEDWYNSTVGNLLEPLLAAYSGVRNLPIIGNIVNAVFDVFNWVGDLVLQAALSVTGLDDEFKDLVIWLADRVGTFFGMGPVVDGSEGGMEISNKIAAGGVALAESSLRYAGGAVEKTLANDPGYDERLVAEYKKEQLENMSLAGRWFGTSNPNSITSRVALSVPNSVNEAAQGISLDSVGSILGSFIKPVFAQANSQTPNEFSGMDAYGYPQETMTSNPLLLELEDCTNADENMNLNISSWEFIQDEGVFWTAVHSRAEELYNIEQYDDEVNKIYNICIMDAQIRNGYQSVRSGVDDGGIGSTGYTVQQTIDNPNSVEVIEPIAPPASGDVGPQDGVTCPDCIQIQPGSSIASIVDTSAAGASFFFAAGTYNGLSISPKSGQTFIGENGAILNGGGSEQYAFISSAPNVTVRNFEITNYATPQQFGTINGDGANWLIANNNIHHNGGGGVRITGDNSRVLSNYIHHNLQIGITSDGANQVIENNEVSYNNYLVDYEWGWEAGGTKFWETTNLVIRNNFFHHNHGPGIWSDNDNQGTLYDGNVVEDNCAAGIFHEISYSAIIRNNSISRNGGTSPPGCSQGWYWGAGIMIAGSSGVEVYNNTLVDNDNGITVIDQCRDDNGKNYLSVGNSAHDNILVNSGQNGAISDCGGNPELEWYNNTVSEGPAAIPLSLGQPTSDGGCQTGPFVGSCAYSHNTGYGNRSLTKSNGSRTIRQAGTVIDGEEINGTVRIEANNVVIRNSWIYTTSPWTIYVGSGSLTIENTEIGHQDYVGERGVGGSNVTGRNLNIHHVEDGIKLGSNSNYSNVWVHDLDSSSAEPHADALQAEGSLNNSTVVDSTLEALWAVSSSRNSSNNTGGANAAVIIKSDLGAQGNVTFENTYFNGGNYVIFVRDGGYGAPTNVTFKDNLFGSTRRYGLIHYNEAVNDINNRWYDTGELLSL